eukprot:3820406-Pyramimonas_sp.AAC.1
MGTNLGLPAPQLLRDEDRRESGQQAGCSKETEPPLRAMDFRTFSRRPPAGPVDPNADVAGEAAGGLQASTAPTT